MTVLNAKDLKIELAQDIDIPVITKLVNAAYKELSDRGLNYTATYQNDEKTKERISKGRCFVLKDNSNKILGTILMTIENYFTHNHTAYLGQLGVLPEFKKMGLGTKMMKFCEDLAMKEGFSGIQLDTAIPAKHLVEWYQRRGYKIVGQEHYEGKTYDSYVFEKRFPMEKTLTPPKLRLERPSPALFSNFLEFIEDMQSHNQTLWDPYLPKKDDSPEQFVERLLLCEVTPEPPFVPDTIYWAVYEDQVVGRISLRHRLEGNLHKMGGHIGYEVGPKWRRRGFATEMLRLVLETPKAKEIGKVLLTCSPKNEASNKTILKNGGIFDKTIFVDFISDYRNHYWIKVRS